MPSSATSLPPGGLKARVATGFKWYLLGMGLQRLLSLGAMAVIARRLEPPVFGVFALAFVAIDGLTIFQNLGLSTPLVQRKDLTPRIVHTAFLLIAGSGTALFVACYAIAPIVAIFYHNDALVGVIRALGLLLLFGCISRVPVTLLYREMRFRTLQVINLVGAVLNSLLSVLFVLRWPTVWSLVFAYLAKQLVVSVLNLAISGYRPRLEFDRVAATEMLRFGRVMLGIGLISYIWYSIDNVLVGRLLGTTLLGYFAMASSVGDLANKHIASVVADLMFPAFSRIQDDPDRLKRAFLRTTRIVAVVTIPFGFLLICLAGPLVLTLYGPKWTPTIPLIRLLGVSAVVTGLSGCTSSLFRASGKPKYELQVMLATLALRVPLVIVAANAWGLTGAVLAGLVTGAVFSLVRLQLAGRLIGFSYRDLLAPMSSVAWATAVMIAAILTVQWTLGLKSMSALASPPVVATAVLLSIGALAFLATLFIRDRPLTTELAQLVLRSHNV